MRFATFSSLLATLLVAPGVFAGIGVHCGTTSDATLSDCQALLNDDTTWDAAWAGSSNVCQFVYPMTALLLVAH
jgi:isochorismate hydrolase